VHATPGPSYPKNNLARSLTDSFLRHLAAPLVRVLSLAQYQLSELAIKTGNAHLFLSVSPAARVAVGRGRRSPMRPDMARVLEAFLAPSSYAPIISRVSVHAYRKMYPGAFARVARRRPTPCSSPARSLVLVQASAENEAAEATSLGKCRTQRKQVPHV
jgi:hypothetical protein